MDKEKEPSEMVTASALYSSLPQFLVDSKNKHDLEKFISRNADPELMLHRT